jgi:tripartite-type tricarboxylate transporter receptor subunit TctC
LTRIITLIVPFGPGAVADLVARIVTDRMRVMLGQSFVVEDFPGAGGTIGVERAARAAPDGYTLSTGDLTGHVSSSAIFAVKIRLATGLRTRVAAVQRSAALRRPA